MSLWSRRCRSSLSLNRLTLFVQCLVLFFSRFSRFSQLFLIALVLKYPVVENNRTWQCTFGTNLQFWHLRSTPDKKSMARVRSRFGEFDKMAEIEERWWQWRFSQSVARFQLKCCSFFLLQKHIYSHKKILCGCKWVDMELLTRHWAKCGCKTNGCGGWPFNGTKERKWPGWCGTDG